MKHRAPKVNGTRVMRAGWEGRSQEHYVDVRIYVPTLDVEHVVDGTHPDGITAEVS